MLARDFAPRFPVELIAQDFRYTAASAAQAGAALPVTGAAGAQFEKLLAAGFGAENMSAVLRLFLDAP